MSANKNRRRHGFTWGMLSLVATTLSIATYILGQDWIDAVVQWVFIGAASFCAARMTICFRRDGVAKAPVHRCTPECFPEWMRSSPPKAAGASADSDTQGGERL